MTRMPGFTAEKALAPSTGGYRRTTSPGDRGSAITAQTLRFPADGSQPCIPGCICVSEDGCPCCPTPDPFPPIIRRRKF